MTKLERREDRVAINVEKLKEAVRGSGYTDTEISIVCGKSKSYLNNVWRSERIGTEFLGKACLMLKCEPEEFIIEVPEADNPKEGPAGGAAATQSAELRAEITAINDAMASMVRMLETVQNSVKRISDEVSTLKDVEYTAAQESKRFYQAGNAMFKSIQYWLKGKQ